MDAPTPTTSQKALAINLAARTYGTFAEIGGGQEVSRWFFAVGGAAGTVAKSISAYDMAVSDSLYGPTKRYVSRERLEAMLERELSQLVSQLGSTRGDAKSFFSFANTVATRRFGALDNGRGWLGVRFQARPHEEPSEIVIHAYLLDRVAAQGHLRLGHLRRGTGAAPGFLEEAAAAAALGLLRLAQQPAALEYPRLPGEHLAEEVDGVIEVLPGQRVVAFGEQGPHFARDFIHTLF